MANTFSCLNIHCVFSTKERVWVLNPDIRERLWSYMGGIAKQNGMIPKCIGGVSDHVHLLVTLPTRLAVAKVVQLIGRIIGSDSLNLSEPPDFALTIGLWRIPPGLAGRDHTVPYGTVLSRDAFPGTSCQASAPLRPTSPQVKVLHCLTVKGQEAQRKGVAVRRGLKQRSAR